MRGRHGKRSIPPVPAVVQQSRHRPRPRPLRAVGRSTPARAATAARPPSRSRVRLPPAAARSIQYTQQTQEHKDTGDTRR